MIIQDAERFNKDRGGPDMRSNRTDQSTLVRLPVLEEKPPVTLGLIQSLPLDFEYMFTSVCVGTWC